MKDVDEYIDTLPEKEQRIATTIREMLLDLVPGIQEKISFKIPFYHYFGMFCYINKIENGIDFGLCRGKDLAYAFPALEIKNRAIVATVSLYEMADIETKEIRSIITAAALWNEEARKNKIPMIKKR